MALISRAAARGDVERRLAGLSGLLIAEGAAFDLVDELARLAFVHDDAKKTGGIGMMARLCAS